MLRKLKILFYFIIVNNQLYFLDGLRSSLFKVFAKNKGIKNLLILSGVFVEGFPNLYLGNNVSINQNCFLSCYGGLTIGDNVAIGHNVSILTTDHVFSDLEIPIKEQKLIYKEVKIGDNVYIGAKATILAGVSIPNGTVIGAGSVVTKSFTEENCIIAGVPAKLIKKR
jgi:acetyltransferase-like isoleucine patch superfamily enzyme